MRHIVLFVLAVATAFWLAPAFHVLPQHKRDVAIAVIIAVFFVADLAIGRRKKPRTRELPPPPRRRAGAVR